MPNRRAGGEPLRIESSRKKGRIMVAIKFTDRQAQKRAIGFLAGQFSGRVLRSGEVLVPEAALEALAEENFSFTVLGKATYDQMAAIRGDAASPVQ